MAIVPRVIVDETQLRGSLAGFVNSHTDAVARIVFQIRADWTGETSLFFQILLRDQAAGHRRLTRVTREITNAVSAMAQSAAPGCNVYFEFRTESEQAMLDDPIWQ